MSTPTTLLSGLSLGESPRWHDGRLWLCDWGQGEVLAVDAAGTSEVMARVPSFPFCIDWLPDGRLLVVAGGDAKLLVQEPDGTLADYADLSHLTTKPWNEVTVDGAGNAYVNSIGFDFPGEPPSGDVAPGMVAFIRPDGTVRAVADDLAFPNGMALTDGGSTLVVAESYRARLTAFDVESDGGLGNRRVWADLGAGAAPDGICVDADGAIWYADVPNRGCTLVAEGGQVLSTVDLELGGFSCVLGGPAGRTLFMVVADWGNPEMMTARTGQVLTLDLGSAA